MHMVYNNLLTKYPINIDNNVLNIPNNVLNFTFFDFTNKIKKENDVMTKIQPLITAKK